LIPQIIHFQILEINSPAKLPKLLPTEETSRECVNLLCTKTLPGRGKTWVLFCNLLKAEEKLFDQNLVENLF
jgi:hypothetical protein